MTTKTYEIDVAFTTLLEASSPEEAKEWVMVDLEDFFNATNREVTVIKEVTADV